MNLVITEFGMVTSVGHDAATSCAAIRAGITRAAPLPQAQVLDPDTQTMIPAAGHPVFALTEGASAVARWLTLARHAFLDLRGSDSLAATNDEQFWARTGLALVTPVLDDERFMFFAAVQPGAIQTSYVDPLVRSLAVGIDPSHVYLLSEGRTGAVRAIGSMESVLAKKQLDRLVILSADSGLDGHSLAWFMESERLKQADQPAGLMPGEAAAALLIETEDAARARGARCRARLSAAVTDSEPHGFVNGERQHGRATARVLGSALRSAGAVAFSGDVITDLNGEAWRAYEFGAASVQVSRSLLNDPRIITPAMSIGDVGAASALVESIVAVRAFERGYATSTSTLVACMSASGRVGAMLLTRN